MTHEYKTNDSRMTIRKKSGAIYLVLLLVMSGVFIFLATAIMSLAFANVRLARHNEAMVSSLSIAEAGVNYYLWHLAKAPADYCDGGTCNQPYERDFTDPDGNILGSFDLYITPPAPGGTATTIKSVGTAKGATVSRTVIANLGMPSFAGYAFLSDQMIYVKQGDKIDGPVHSNSCIQFDGLANDLISASSDSEHPCLVKSGVPYYGVWTTGGGGPTVYFQFPTSRVDFDEISVALDKIKVASKYGGLYLPKSSKLGYHLTLKPDHTIDVTTVASETVDGFTESTPAKNYPAPINGVLYADDYLWVDGTWNSKITIANPIPAIKKSSTFYAFGYRPSILIANNLLYQSKNGTNKIGLITIGDISIPPYAPSSIEIDAAMSSQKGHVWYPYSTDRSILPKDQITIYGAISSYQFPSWTYLDANDQIINGFKNVSSTYDHSLTLDPPPFFPTTGDYQILSWREE